MKIVIDIEEDYYEIIKHDVKVNRNDFKPYTIIANGTQLPKRMSWGHTADFIEGYNACLEEITGETE